MRLPYMQLEMEVIEQAAPELAVTLEMEEEKAGWGLVKLFKWALGRCPDDKPPSASAVVESKNAARLVAMAAQFKGDPDAFVEACEACRPQILERVPNGIRVKGLGRYDAAWHKNNPIKSKEYRSQPENGPETGQVPGENRANSPRQIERKKKSKTKNQSLSSERKNVPEQVEQRPADEFRLTGEAEPKQKKLSEGQEFWEWAQEQRARETGLLREVEPDPATLNSWFARAIGEVRALRRIQVAWATYLRKPKDRYWPDRGFPFNAFMTDKEWRFYVPPEDRAA